MKLFVLLLLFALNIACNQSKEESDVISNNGAGESTGGSTGETAGSTYTVDPSSETFMYAIQTLSARAGIVVSSPSFPSAATPTIDSSSSIVSLTPPVLPSNQSLSIVSAQNFSGVSGSVINGLDTPRAHNILLTSDISSCTSSMDLSCAVNTSNTKLLNLSGINISSFTTSTTNFNLTVDGSSLSIPISQNKVTRTQDHEPGTGNIQFNFRLVSEAISLGTYIYFVGVTSISGSTYSALYRVHKNTYDAGLFFNPNQSPVSGGNVKNLSVFNNELYFTSRINTTGDYHLLKYNPNLGIISRLSSDTQLLNASHFIEFNNYLYFAANSSGGHNKLYKLSTTGSFKQLTDLCSTKSDVGHKFLKSDIGIYISFANPGQCGTTNTDMIIGRLKADDSIVPLAVYAPGATDNTNDGLGSIASNGVAYYFSAGDNYYLYKDNNDGTITPLIVDVGGWGNKPTPVKNFILTTSGIYWLNTTGSYAYVYQYDTTNATLKRNYHTSGLFTGEVFKVGDTPYIVFNTMSTYQKIHKINSDNSLQQLVDLYPSGHDVINYPYTYNGDFYFYAKNSNGHQKIHKLTTSGKVVQISNINTIGNELDGSSSRNIVGTQDGIILSTTANDFLYLVQ